MDVLEYITHPNQQVLSSSSSSQENHLIFPDNFKLSSQDIISTTPYSASSSSLSSSSLSFLEKKESSSGKKRRGKKRKRSASSQLVEIQRKKLNSDPSRSILIDPSQSILIGQKHISLIYSWIANDTKDSYNLNLLLRASVHGFSPKTFHQICDYKGPTLTIIKVLGSQEILGGYNPLFWDSTCKHGINSKTKDSFIFSINFFNEEEKIILSRVQESARAIFQHKRFGPSFGRRTRKKKQDLKMIDMGMKIPASSCKRNSYEKKIRESDKPFFVEDYEVFQVIKNDI
ncbi:hypothetical protein Glove_352g62 [Diversispora epigaea]|uniref:TLDc domain-containing protein n=1 Tax=Diversispora epigaea TaxID=1348612 RepID=A0A397HJF2_9GLOM|nr:hypothetical protein Glove_352g62 [Diversispora epigaea]